MLPPEESGVRSLATWAHHDGIELPVGANQLEIGRFVVVPVTATCGVALETAAREHALALTDRVGAAIAARVLAEETLHG